MGRATYTQIRKVANKLAKHIRAVKYEIPKDKSLLSAEEFERNLKIYKHFISEPYDLFKNSNWGLRYEDSVCAVAVPVEEDFRTINEFIIKQ